MNLPFSQACENNKEPILKVLQNTFKTTGTVLEIAGGTGQHAVYFAKQLPFLYWQSSDIAENVDTLNLRIAVAGLENLPPALPFDVTQTHFRLASVDYIFSANSLHIMPASALVHFFRHAGNLLNPHGILCVYGPFKYHGEFTSPSNAQFDLWLKANNPESGIRDFETVVALAQQAGLGLLQDHAMPANNQLLAFTKEQ